MRQRRDANPRDDLTGDRIIFFELIVENMDPCRVGAEDKVVAIGAFNVSTVGALGESRIGSTEQKWEISLISVWNFRVVDDNRAHIAVRRGCALSGCKRKCR